MSSLPSSSTRLVWPGLAGFYDTMREVSYLILRIAAGLMIAPHGAQKLFAWFGGGGITGTTKFFASLHLMPAEPLAIFVGALEVFGGVLLALGLFTRPIAAAFAIEMAVVTVHVTWPRGAFFLPQGAEFGLVLGFLFFFLSIIGGGKWSVDRAIGKEI